MIENHLLEIGWSVAIVVGIFILRTILAGLVRRFARKSEKVINRTNLIIKHVDFAMYFLAILALIIIWGVEIKDLGFVMSSVFAVIGIGFFAQWSILSNVTSGIIMFFTFPYRIGDYIVIHDKDFDYQGTIEDIRGFHTLLKTQDGRLITYPNSLMLQKGVSVIKPEELNDFLEEKDEL
jgi:small-conductance mechanosensitive channel